MAPDTISSPEAKPSRTRKLSRYTTKGSLLSRALGDLFAGLLSYRIWGVLGGHEVRQQYRRSTFGPFWITLSMAIFIGLLGVLYAQLFNRELRDYLPHLTVGYVIWTLMSSFVENGARCFINAEGIIKQMFAPLSVHAYRLVWVNLLTLLHHAVIVVAVWAIFQISPNINWLLVLPGLALIFTTGTWVALLLGTIAARFRDIPPIVSAGMRVLFFLTPVIWQADLLPQRAIFLVANPFYHFIELVRGPLMNKPFDPLHWQVAGAVAAGGWILTLIIYRRFRPRVPYWL